MSDFELPTGATIGSAEIKHARRGRFLYASVTLQITPNSRSAKRIEYKLCSPEGLDEYHLRAIRATEISEVNNALEEGVALGLERAGLKGFPMTDCQVTILSAIRNVGESSTVALTTAAAKAVWNALEKWAPLKGFQTQQSDWFRIDFDEAANRWNLSLANNSEKVHL